MTEAAPLELILAGYVSLTSRGFALPCFASGPKSNAWYAARCSIDGDHNGSIIQFELFESQDILELPAEAQVRATVGDPWLDVFLWSGVPYVGTPEALWKLLGPVLHEVAAAAPASLLDLALCSDSSAVGGLLETARKFVSSHYGAGKADAWCADTVVLPQFRLCARRLAKEVGLRKDILDSPYGVRVNNLGAGKFEIELSEELKKGFAESGYLGRLMTDVTRVADLLDVSVKEPKFTTERDDTSLPFGGEEIAGWNGSGSTGVNILVVVRGKRAREIARHIRSPDWIPGWLEVEAVEPYEVNRLDAGQEPTKQSLSRIDIAEDPYRVVMPESYASVVFLSDDEFGDGLLLPRWPDAMERAVKLLAPAIPTDRPSKMLTFHGRHRGTVLPGFQAIIDTSAARSPFRPEEPRKALDRRVADIIIGASLLCAGPSPLRRQLLEAPRHGVTPLLTFATSQAGSSIRDHLHINLQLMSEALTQRSSRGGPIVFEGRNIGRLRSNSVSGIVELADMQSKSLSADFAYFAATVVGGVVMGERSISDFDPDALSPLPRDLDRELEYPELRAGFHLDRRGKRGVMVLAETPSVSILRRGSRLGWSPVRYTDRDTLHRLLLERNVADLVPVEVRIPPVRRLSENRSLAIRGVDPRDIVRFGSAEHDAWLAETGETPLVGDVRNYCPSVRMGRDRTQLEYAIPRSVIDKALRNHDRSARRLLSLLQRGGYGYEGLGALRRPADLKAAWSAPARDATRFVIADGVLPISIAEISPGEVPSQRYFFIDGDVSVPALFFSRAFDVWARATVSRSTSWTHRFSLNRTFEAFPIPGCFELVRSLSGQVQLRARPGKRNARVLAAYDTQWQRLERETSKASINGLELGNYKLIMDVNSFILAELGLEDEASDLDILERLLKLNDQGGV